MADSKLTALAAVTSWASGDLLYLGSDPAGTPASKKITLDNVLANVVSRLTVSKNAAASAPPVAITGSWFSGGSATTTKPQLLIEAAGATSTGWATAGTGLGVNAASGFAGNLIDAQVNGVSKASISSIGLMQLANSLIVSGGVYDATVKAGISYNASGEIGGTYLGLGSGGLGSLNVFLYPDAANTLALRNGATAQTLNIYNTYTSGSVYERGFMRWVSNVLEIGTEHVGGSAREIALKRGANNVIASSSAVGVIIGSGASPAVSIGDGGNTGRLGFYAGANIGGVSDGVSLVLKNAGLTGFGLLMFGGATSSFPAIKRSTTILQARLADDSDFATFQGKLRSHANAAAETPTATHTITIYDAAGTAYKVLAVAA